MINLKAHSRKETELEKLVITVWHAGPPHDRWRGARGGQGGPARHPLHRPDARL